jgi:Protein of unknown function (DUF3987)
MDKLCGISFNQVIDSASIGEIGISSSGISNTTLKTWSPSLEEFGLTLSTATIGSKDGPYLVRCAGTERTNAGTEKIAYLLILDGDSRIDENGQIVSGAPDPIEVSRALGGISHIISSSHSNGATKEELDAKGGIDSGGLYDADYHKYRVYIICTYTPEQLPALLEYLFNQLHKAGVMLAPVPENKTWAQAWYLPRVPDSARLELHKFIDEEGARLDVEQIHADWLSTQPAVEEPVFVERTDSYTADCKRDPIAEFNQAVTVHDVLLRNSYVLVGERYQRPNSCSNTPGVTLCKKMKDGKERIYSHGGDVLNDGFAHDAFDCMLLLECDRDWKKALNWNLDITKHNQMLFMEAKAEQGSVTDFNASTHNEILDNANGYQNVDLLQYLSDVCMFKKMCRYVANETNLPESTVLIAGLSIFSSVAARQFYVSYQNGKALPIGLYSVLEQPSGTGKSRCLHYFQQPFEDQLKICKEEISSRLLELERSSNKTDTIKEEIADLTAIRKRLTLFITNATPEGLEKTLVTSFGYFSAASSEQGLFNSLLGNSYNTGANNNDIVLNGFDGGYVSSTRATREGYVGPVIGGICCFAQYGSIETLYNASNGTGLAERFLKLTENHALGTRDHMKASSSSNDDNVLDDYEKVCGFVKNILKKPESLTKLDEITICVEGHDLINAYRNKIEKHLADGGKYSHISMRGAASKVNMQIMKIAANLFLLDRGCYFIETIPIPTIKASINIANDLLEANLKLCMAKDIIGTRAEFTSILSLFERDSRPRSERRIITSKVSTQPFKEITGNKSDKIRETLDEMVLAKLLLITLEPSGAKLYSLSQ